MGVPRSTVSTIWKNRDKYRKTAANNNPLQSTARALYHYNRNKCVHTCCGSCGCEKAEEEEDEDEEEKPPFFKVNRGHTLRSLPICLTTTETRTQAKCANHYTTRVIHHGHLLVTQQVFPTTEQAQSSQTDLQSNDTPFNE
ncbi:hypothetical protein E2C01_003452 [Portunus trituberculatus]|uniref:HTH psq-type domain-containing protein n=1 Tax=Portunus trituberculatus TaxID=210409 RepID=A0A5B7CMV8_PORTR|nr:hypothetical protein [Portunus trituberculatus]